MKFICAGLLKTGTKSLAHALRILGYKVYDFDEQLLHFVDDWYDLYYRDKVPDFYGMFKDVDVVVDFPSNFFFEELMEAFPDAKVILSVRSNEDAWVKSCKNQIEIIQYSFMTKFRHFLPTYNKYHLVGLAQLNAFLGTADPNATYIYRKRYRWHNDRVKAVVPAEKLLLFTVQQGWKPLCDFTGKKIPDQPFPHLNFKGEVFTTFQTETEYGRKIAGEVRIVKIGLAIFVALVAMLFVFLVNVFVF